AGFADPPVGFQGRFLERAPGPEHLRARRERLRTHDLERDVVERLVEILVHPVDVDLLGAIGPGADPLEHEAGLREPAPDVSDEVLGRPPLDEVPRLVHLARRERVDLLMDGRPEPILVGHELFPRCRFRHVGQYRLDQPGRRHERRMNSIDDPSAYALRFTRTGCTTDMGRRTPSRAWLTGGSSSATTITRFPARARGGDAGGCVNALGSRCGATQGVLVMALDTFMLIASQYALEEDALADYEAVRSMYDELGIIDTYDAAVV